VLIIPKPKKIIIVGGREGRGNENRKIRNHSADNHKNASNEKWYHNFL
jgi:hypothetical protein